MIIPPDSKFAREIGFTSDKFEGWLWKVDNFIYISFIESKQPGHGNFSRLLRSIEEKGFGIKVPTPSVLMRMILQAKGFKCTYEHDKNCGNVEVWIKDAGGDTNGRRRKETEGTIGTP